jgi:hypothetical protein
MFFAFCRWGKCLWSVGPRCSRIGSCVQDERCSTYCRSSRLRMYNWRNVGWNCNRTGAWAWVQELQNTAQRRHSSHVGFAQRVYSQGKRCSSGDRNKRRSLSFGWTRRACRGAKTERSLLEVGVASRRAIWKANRTVVESAKVRRK